MVIVSVAQAHLHCFFLQIHLSLHESVCIFSNSFIVLFSQLLYYTAVQNLKGCISPLKYWSVEVRSFSLVRRITANMHKHLETHRSTCYLRVACLHRIDRALCSLNANYCNTNCTQQFPCPQAQVLMDDSISCLTKLSSFA